MRELELAIWRQKCPEGGYFDRAVAKYPHSAMSSQNYQTI